MTEPGSAFRLFTGKVRRFFAVHFRKKYVEGQLKARQGDCSQCAVCCSLAFSCPLLTKDRLCAVYGTFRPLACRAFPIDEKDIEEVRACGGECGYRFIPDPDAHGRS
ncbi:hypothetical protein [Fundidesulfovibrio terrae]|uniref:hypothetical protein n=1 Tax=Fundidesulfovibrio terrae TaxID=2922866 RepID=UPI001FAF2BFB|nr:hypothetical protein [Fundidesulfovibrio terrae]